MGCNLSDSDSMIFIFRGSTCSLNHAWPQPCDGGEASERPRAIVTCGALDIKIDKTKI